MFESKARQPRALVFVNGIQTAWYEIEVNNNGFFQADSFRIKIPATKYQDKTMTRAWWREQGPIRVEVYLGQPKDPDKFTKEELTLMIVGNVDELPHDLVPDVMVLYGRDYTSLMIESKIVVDDHVNKRASDIAIEYAEKYELSTKYITKTTDTIGTIYKHAFTKLNRSTTEWNFLCFLAQEEFFECFVRGKDLHFEPLAKNPPIYEMIWKDEDVDNLRQFYGTKLTVTRNLTLAKDIIVYLRVKSIKAPHKPFTVPARSRHTKDPTLNRGHRYIGTPQAIFRIEDVALDKKKAFIEAERILAEVSRHQMKLIADGIPADEILTPQHIIRLKGTGSYDKDYHHDSIIINISVEHGYKMNIIAKNHDVNSVMPV